MKICFLGGAFDPPHVGHLKIALECLKQCDKFIFIPSKQSPHKINRPYFSSSHRLAMLNMLASNYDNITVDPFEINSIKYGQTKNVIFELDKEVKRIVRKKTNQQLNRFSNIYFNKIKKDIIINEL